MNTSLLQTGNATLASQALTDKKLSKIGNINSQSFANTLQNTYKLQGANLNANNTDKRKKEATDAAQQFEAMYIGEMLRPMFENEDVDPLFGGGQAEKIYRSMLVDEYGKAVAKAGGMGIAKNIEQELLNKQQVTGELK